MSEIEQAIVLTKWAQKWLKFAWNIVTDGTPTEQLARSILSNMDMIVEDPCTYVEEHCEERTRTVVRKHDIKNVTKTVRQEGDDGNGTTTCREDKMAEDADVFRVVVSRKVVQRLVRGRRSSFAASLAKVAYNKFGERPMSPANLMVTRKWIQKYLEEHFKDLRTSDKNIAIDRALFLSFVPTKEFLKMRVLIATKEAESRMSGQSVFGKIFQFARSTPPGAQVGPQE